MKRYLALTLLLLTGCTAAKSPEYITYYLNRAYANRPVNEFFANYGFPSAEWGNERHTIYRWDSMHHEYAPTTVTTSVTTTTTTPTQTMTMTSQPRTYTPSGPVPAANPDTYHGSVERAYCEIRIYTRDNVIQNFAVAVDTIGRHSTSRCSEVFDKVYPDALWF